MFNKLHPPIFLKTMKAKKLSVIALSILFILCFSSIVISNTKGIATLFYDFTNLEGWENIAPNDLILYPDFVNPTSYNRRDSVIFRSYGFSVGILQRTDEISTNTQYSIYNRTNTWQYSSPIWNVFTPDTSIQEFEPTFFVSHKPEIGLTFWDDLNLTGSKTITIEMNFTSYIYDGDTGESIQNATNIVPATWTLTSSNITANMDLITSLQSYSSNMQSVTLSTNDMGRLRYVINIGTVIRVSGDYIDNPSNIVVPFKIASYVDDFTLTNFNEGSKTDLISDVSPEPDITDFRYRYPFEFNNPNTSIVSYISSWSGFDVSNNFSIFLDPNIYRGEEVFLSGITYNSIPYSVDFLHYFNKNESAQDFRLSFNEYPTLNLTFVNPNDDSNLNIRFFSRIYYVSGTMITANIYKNINITVRFFTSDGTLIQETPVRNMRFFETNKTLDDSTFIGGTVTLTDSNYNSVNMQIRLNSSIFLDTGLGASEMSIIYRTYIDTVSSNWESGLWNPLTNQPYPNEDPYPEQIITTVTYTDTVEDYIVNQIIAPSGLGQLAGGLFFTLILMLVIVIIGFALEAPPIVYIMGAYMALFLCFYLNLVPLIVMIMVIFATVLFMSSFMVSIFYKR